VASVLIGARNADEIRDAMTLATRPLPADMWRKLRNAGLLPQQVPLPGMTGV
jgi:D-threo-aldose 1-dehydrogenase